MGRNSSKNWSFLICLTLVLTAFAVFYQVCNFEFVHYDDPVYVFGNLKIQAGITLETVKWAFLSISHASIWHPLTWLSHMLDWQLFGSNAGGHHLTNLIFHIANTLLLFLVLKQMTSALWQSAFVAALFALHPLHVESVAWVSERKDVLSTFFWILTIWAYVHYVSRPKIAGYLLVVAFYALGLMSKSMLVTLPFVLLLLDYWPLGRFREKRSLPRLLIEKIPLFVMSLASCIVTFIAQKKGGVTHSLEDCGLSIRLANASISYVQYIIKMIWPARLAMFYPHPGQNVSIFYAVLSVIFLLIITILIIRFSSKHRYLFTGWFWYIGTLVPVIGLVQVGDQAMADRYSYITLTGLFIIVAWGVPELFEKLPYRRAMLGTSALIVLSALAICTYLQTQYWKDTITLCQHALKVTENNYMAHFEMTGELIKQGRIEEAIRHNYEAVRIKPRFVHALNALGLSLCCAGRFDDSIGYYKRAIEINPNFSQAHLNLASVYLKKGDFAQAVFHYKIAEKTLDMIIPDDPNILNDIGYAFANCGEFEKAISLYNKALKIAPDSINIHLNLGFALSGSGKLEEAIKEFEKILLIQPDNAIAHNSLGAVFAQQGKIDQAIIHFSQAVRIDPQNTDAKNNLNIAIAEKQKSDKSDTESYKK